LELTVLRLSAREVFENTKGALERIFELLPNPP